MQFAPAITTERDPESAVTALADRIGGELSDGRPDLALMFICGHALSNVAQIAEGVRARLGPRVFAACTAEGVIGHEQELERKAAVALVTAQLPGVELTPFAVEPENWNEALDSGEEFRRALTTPDDPQLFVFLADPLS